MRTSFIISALILFIAAGFAWRSDGQLSTARESHRRLVAEAGKLGFTIHPSHSSIATRFSRREREDRNAQTREAISDFIVHGRELAAWKDSNQYSDLIRKRSMELDDLMASLDDAQIKEVITGIWLNGELDKDVRGQLIVYPMMALAPERPQLFPAFFLENSDLFRDSGTQEIVARSLGHLAKTDPLAALAWFQKNGDQFPDVATEDAKLGIISGAAYHDPKTAFQLIRTLGFDDPADSIRRISQAAATDEDRDQTLAALRDYLKTIPDENSRATANQSSINLLAPSAARDGFDSAHQWIESANFTPDELESIVRGGFYREVQPRETGQWIDWLGKNLPAEKSNSIAPLFATWTHTDHAAASNWLTTAPEGPVKTIAIQSFAETVAPYQPETAAQWAMTLPPGDARDSTLRTIYQNWPKDEPAAAEAAENFATEHGLR